MPERGASRKSFDRVARINNILAIDERELLGHATFAYLRLNRKR
jgi:hypothetical protein